MVPILLVCLLVFFVSSTPIAVALGLSGFFSLLFGSTTEPMIVIQRLVGGIDSFSLMALPFFIFAANLMFTGGLSKRLLNFCGTLVGHISGGIAQTTQLTSMFFGALSGSSPATIIAVGKMMQPEMDKQKYPSKFVSGLLASSGSVALIDHTIVCLYVVLFVYWPPQKLFLSASRSCHWTPNAPNPAEFAKHRIAFDTLAG